jgi:hypothetical protein
VPALVVGNVSERRSAIVVLRSPIDSPTATRAEELVSDPAAAAAVQEYFVRLGFQVGPLVGVSFAIDGNQTLFESVFGPKTGEFDLARIPVSIRAWLVGVTATEPPTFGPDRP